MSKLSHSILEASSGALNKIGKPFKGDGYHSVSDGLHTVAVYYSEFVGRFYMEATLVNNPTDEDWFPVILEEEQEYYAQFNEHFTGVKGYTFTGNFVYVRAVVSRDHMVNPQLEKVGIVNKVLLNY